jgi:hypothetical protein
VLGARDAGRAGPAAHCCSLQNRGRDPRWASRGATPPRPDSRRTAADGTAHVVARDVPMFGRVSAKSELAAAIGCSLTRWQALTRCLDDGRIDRRPSRITQTANGPTGCSKTKMASTSHFSRPR